MRGFVRRLLIVVLVILLFPLALIVVTCSGNVVQSGVGPVPGLQDTVAHSGYDGPRFSKTPRTFPTATPAKTQVAPATQTSRTPTKSPAQTQTPSPVITGTLDINQTKEPVTTNKGKAGYHYHLQASISCSGARYTWESEGDTQEGSEADFVVEESQSREVKVTVQCANGAQQSLAFPIEGR
jgi:hypothetical protein